MEFENGLRDRKVVGSDGYNILIDLFIHFVLKQMHKKTDRINLYSQ